MIEFLVKDDGELIREDREIEEEIISLFLNLYPPFP